MSSSRHSSASSSRSKSRGAEKPSKKGKSIIKRTIDRFRKASESNHSDDEIAGPSGITTTVNDALPNIENWEMDPPEQEGDQNSDNEQLGNIERGRFRDVASIRIRERVIQTCAFCNWRAIQSHGSRPNGCPGGC